MLSEEANSFFLAVTAALLVGAAAVAGAPSASKLMIRAVTARMYFPRAARSPRGRVGEMRHSAWRFCGAAQKGRAGTIPKLAGFGFKHRNAQPTRPSGGPMRFAILTAAAAALASLATAGPASA